MILLDTDICIELLHGNENVLRKRKEENDAPAISFMTAAELFYGAAKSNRAAHNTEIVERFLITLSIIQSDIQIVRAYAEIKRKLETIGFPFSDADLFIAATALTKCERLITGNVEHYQRIEELRIENWIR